MERHTLFLSPDEKIYVTSAFIFFLERSSGEPVLYEMHLTINEEMLGFLYVGCSDGTMHMFRIVTRLNQEGVRYDLSTTFLQKKNCSVSKDDVMSDNVSDGVLHGVTFLHIIKKAPTPELLLLVDGVMDILHYTNLNSIRRFQHLLLSLGPVTTCCVARAQGDVSRYAQRFAALIGHYLVLIEYTESGACFLGDHGETEGIEFGEVPHIIVPDDTQTMAWQRDFIVTGSSREYCVFDVNSRQMQQRMAILDTLSKGPLCRYMKGYGDSSSILIRIGDSQLALFDAITETDLETLVPVKLSEPVIDVAWAPPFFIGVKSDGNILMRSCLEDEEFSTNGASSSFSFDLNDKPHQMHSTPIGVYGVCKHSVCFFILMPPKTLTAIYINAGHYERAIRYVEHAYNTPEEDYLQRIYDACAHHALNCKKYADAFRYLELASTPTLELLELVPELKYPLKKTDKSDCNVKLTWSSGEPYHVLYELLLRRRTDGLRNNTEEQRAIEFAIFVLYVLECVPYSDDELTDFFLSSPTLVPAECLCYVGEDGVRPKPKVAPLVLACDGEFEEALKCCQSRRFVHEASIVLQMCGDERLYAQYFPWVLSVDVNSALRAVICPRGRSPPVSLILPILLGYGGCTLHNYLRHLIFVEGNTETQIHTLYVTNLIDIIRSLQSFGMKNIKSTAVKVRAGDESGLHGITRQALLEFLQYSSHYETNVVLSLLFDVGLVEEQVLVLEQTGDHIGALTTLVYELEDIDSAVRYCEVQHAREIQRLGKNNNTYLAVISKDSGPCTPQAGHNELLESVIEDKNDFLRFSGNPYAFQGSHTFNEYFNILLYVLLVPPAGKQRLLSEALTVLNEHSRYINPLSVLNSLPNEVCITQISSYLLRAFQTLSNQIQMAEVSANAAASMITDAQRRRDLLHQRCVYVDEKRLCVVCGKPLGTGVLAIFPNLKTTHFRCFRAHELDPERGVPFRMNL